MVLLDKGLFFSMFSDGRAFEWRRTPPNCYSGSIFVEMSKRPFLAAVVNLLLIFRGLGSSGLKSSIGFSCWLYGDTGGRDDSVFARLSL